MNKLTKVRLTLDINSDNPGLTVSKVNEKLFKIGVINIRVKKYKSGRLTVEFDASPDNPLITPTKVLIGKLLAGESLSEILAVSQELQQDIQEKLPFLDGGFLKDYPTESKIMSKVKYFIKETKK